MEASFLKTPEGLFDQAVEQVGITASKSTSDLGALLRHRVLEIEGSRVHTTDTYGRGGRKDAKWEFGEAAVGEVETPGPGLLESKTWRRATAKSLKNKDLTCKVLINE